MEEQNVAAASAAEVDSGLETGSPNESPQLGIHNKSQIASEGQASSIEKKKAKKNNSISSTVSDTK